MKIMNEKGKLFGIINVIDLVVLVILILVIGAVGYKVLGSKLDKALGTNIGTKDIIFTVKCQSRSEAAAKALQPGDQLVSLTSKVDAYIVSVSYTAADVPNPNAQGQQIYSKDAYKKDVLVTAKMKSSANVDIFKLGSQEVAVNKVFVVKTQKVDLTGFTESITVK